MSDTALRQRIVDKLIHWLLDIEFFHDLEMFPSLSGFSDFFLTTQFGGRTKLSKNIFAGAKLIVDDDATPAVESKEADYNWVFGVGVNF